MHSEVSGSSISSFFSANSSRRETLMNLTDLECDSDGSDTVTDNAYTPPVRSSSIKLALGVTLESERLLSISLSIGTLSSVGSSPSFGSIPLFPVKHPSSRYSPFVPLATSPFVRRKPRSLSICSDDAFLKSVVSAPTGPRLEPMIMEKLYIAGWAEKLQGRCAPEHIPWDDLHDQYAPMPWIPEGSLVSKDMFYQIRNETRPKSYSPPPSPTKQDAVPAADRVTSSNTVTALTERTRVLKRSASCHPSCSWRVRREALVVDGEVSVDNGQTQKRWSTQLPASSSEHSGLDASMRWHKMSAFHESGLERLKQSMMQLMEDYEETSIFFDPALPAVASKRACFDIAPADLGLPTRPQSKLLPTLPLAIRRGKKVPSNITVRPVNGGLEPLPYPDIPTPYRGSPSAGTPLFEFAASTHGVPTSRSSMDATGMCDSLRLIVKPLATPSSATFPQNDVPIFEKSLSFELEGSTCVKDEEDSRVTVSPDEWAFAENLWAEYGQDPFSYFSNRSRANSSASLRDRPLSTIPEASAAEISADALKFNGTCTLTPSYATALLQEIVIPEITISDVEPNRSRHRSSMSFESVFSGDPQKALEFSIMSEIEIDSACSSSDSGHSSIQSLDEEYRPLLSRRRSLDTVSTVEPQVPSSAKMIQGILKPSKSVRFASSPGEHVYSTHISTTSSPGSYRSRSPPLRSSLRQPSPLRHEFSAADIELLKPPSPIVKKSRFSLIPLSGRLSPLGKPNAGAKENDQPRLNVSQETPKKKRFSMIPRSPILEKKLEMGSPVESEKSTGRPSTPSQERSSRKPSPQLTPKRTASWTSSLRSYGGGVAKNENEMRRQEIRSSTPTRMVSPIAGRKSKAPSADAAKLLKKASPLPVNIPKRSTTPQPRGPIKSGAGIGYIASPPRVSTPRLRKSAGKENGAKGLSRESNQKAKKPLRTILGRLTG